MWNVCRHLPSKTTFKSENVSEEYVTSDNLYPLCVKPKQSLCFIQIYIHIQLLKASHQRWALLYNNKCVLKLISALAWLSHLEKRVAVALGPETCFPSSAIFWSRGRTCWTNTTKEQRPFPTRSLLITQQRTNTHFAIKSHSLHYNIIHYTEHNVYKGIFHHRFHRNASANDRAS